MKVQFKLLSPFGHVPTQARPTDAGFDVYAAENIRIGRGDMRPVRTNVAIAVPKGYYFTVRGRSGMARHHRIDVFDGTIDATYNGELIIILINHSENVYVVQPGERIAQIVFHECCQPDTWEEVKEFGPEYDVRGTHGFGSSGK